MKQQQSNIERQVYRNTVIQHIPQIISLIRDICITLALS